MKIVVKNHSKVRYKYSVVSFTSLYKKYRNTGLYWFLTILHDEAENSF